MSRVWPDWSSFLTTIPAEAAYLGPWEASRREECQARMFDYVARSVAEPVEYLEFGVGTGSSLRAAGGAFAHADSRFFGFDTFSGHPEDWHGRIEGYAIREDIIFSSRDIFQPAGAFDVRGRTPAETGVVVDPRAEFIRGLVQDTLPAFLEGFQPRGPLVVNIDINLYSGALFILATLHNLVRRGDIIMFDELYDLDGEFLALNNYLKAFNMQGRFVCCCHDGKVFGFRIV